MNRKEKIAFLRNVVAGKIDKTKLLHPMPFIVEDAAGEPGMFTIINSGRNYNRDQIKELYRNSPKNAIWIIWAEGYDDL